MGFVQLGMTYDSLEINMECSLSDAILAANTDTAVGGCPAGDGEDLIDLSGMSGTIDLYEPLPPITDTLTIVGPGSANLTIRRAPDSLADFPIFQIDGGNVLLGDLTISGGRASSGGGIVNNGANLTLQSVHVTGNEATSSGGGILNRGGTLTLTVGTVVEGNHAGSSGGGIYNDGGAVAILDSSILQNTSGSSGAGFYNDGAAQIEHSTVYGNQAASAGGGLTQADGSLTLISSTVSGNRAHIGGALYVQGGSANAVNATIADNSADQVGGVRNDGAFDFHNTILSDNENGDCGGILSSSGYNLIQDAACQITGDLTGNIIGQSALLSTLVMDGGLTLVQLPDENSPALGGGSPPADCAATDQRGASRSQGASCDMGAVEILAGVPVTWISATSGSWTTGSNWSTGVVPGAADDVILDVPAAVTVTLSTNVTVNSISSKEHLQQTGGTVTLSAPSVFDGAYTLTSGTITSVASRTFNGPFTWNAGIFSGAGAIQNNGIMSMNGSGSKTITGGLTFTNNGTVSWTGGYLYLNSSSIFQNAATGIFDAHASDDTITYSSSPSGQFVNAGTFLATSGIVYPGPVLGDTGSAVQNPGVDAAVGSGRIYVYAPFSNTGTVNVQQGSLELNGTSSSSGSYLGNVRFTGGTHTLLDGAVVDGATIAGGTVTLAADATIGGANFTFASGTLQAAPGAVGTIGGSFNWLGGTVNGSGTIRSTGAMTIDGSDKYIQDTVRFVAMGTTTWPSSTMWFYNSAVFENAGTLTFPGAPAGSPVIESPNDGRSPAAAEAVSGSPGLDVIRLDVVPMHFENTGLFTTANGATPNFSVAFYNDGTINIPTGKLTISGGGQSSGTFIGNVEFAGGTNTIFDGASLGGSLVSGTMIIDANAIVSANDITFTGGTFTNNGQVTLNGATTWIGSYLSGSLTIPAGTTATLSGSATKSIASGTTLTNNGTINWLGGTIDCYSCTNAILENNGTFNVSFPSATNATLSDTYLNNNGSVNVSAQSFYVYRGLSTGLIKAITPGIWQTNNYTLDDGTSIQGDFTFNSGVLNIVGAVDLTGKLTWAGGIFDGAGSLVGSGEWDLSGGSMYLYTTTNLTSMVTMRWLSGAVYCYSCTGGVINNAATLSVDPGAGNTASFNNGALNNSGTISIQTGILYLYSGTTTGTIQGTPGTFLRSNNYTLGDGATLSGALTFNSGTLSLAGMVNLPGTLNWLAGNVSGTGTFQGAGEFVIDSTSSKYFLSGTTIGSNGVMRWKAGTIYCSGCSDGVLNNNGTLIVDVGSINTATLNQIALNNSGTVDIQTGTFYVYGGTTTGAIQGTSGAVLHTNNHTLANNATIGGTLTFNSGILNLTGNVNLPGTLTWSGGGFNGTGTFQGTGELVVNGSGSKYIYSGTTITNAMTMRWSAGTIDCNGCTNGALNNNGTLIVDVGSGGTAYLSDTVLTNNGTVNLMTGVFRPYQTVIQSGGTWTFNGGNLTGAINLQGGTLSGAGTISGNVINAATINVGGTPGTLTISGTYTQTGSGVLNVQIGGTTAGSQYDRLAISGAASLAGTLNLSLINSFIPAVGNAFDVLTFGSRTGTFTTVTGTDIGGGLQLTPAYTTTKVTINTVAA